MSEGVIDQKEKICKVKDDLQSQLDQTQVQVDASANATGKPTKGNITKPVEDPNEKVERYEDGVDEVADEIGGLDAFDKLCEAIDDDEDPKAHLAAVRASGAYKKLCEMWAGALEGGSVAHRMQNAFNNMFDGRGFWASTEQAFTMVADAAKRDAVLPAEAKAAKGQAQEATGKDPAQEGEGKEGGKDGDKGGKPGGEGGGGGGGGAGKEAAFEQYAGKSVDSPEAPPIPVYLEAEKIHGLGQDSSSGFALASQEFAYYGEHKSKVNEMAKDPGTRFNLVMKEAGNALFGGLLKGGIEQGKDSLITDLAGGALDKGLQALTKGKLKAPLIGPALNLVQSGLVSDVLSGNIANGKFVSGLKDNVKNIGKGFGNAGENFGKFDGSLDKVGYLFAGIADVLGALAEIVDMAATILGTLSALAYVLGGILVLVGIALLWLAGIGAPLVTAGGWLIKAGNVLSKIVTVLGPIGIALNAGAAFFRILAALTVPAEGFADQLSGVNENVGKFGEKAGAKIADTTAGKLKEAAAKKIAPKTADNDAAANKAQQQGEGQGQGDAQKKTQQLDGDTTQAEQGLQAAKDARAKAEAEAKKAGQDGDQQNDPNAPKKPQDGQNDPNAPKDGQDPQQQRPQDGQDPQQQRPQDGQDPQQQRPQGGDTAPLTRGQKIKAAVGTVLTCLNPFSGIRDQFSDARQALKDGWAMVSSRDGARTAAYEGVDMALTDKTKTKEAYKKRMAELQGGMDTLRVKLEAADQNAKKLQTDYDSAKTELQGLKDKLKDLDPSDPEYTRQKAELKAKIKEQQKTAKDQLKELNDAQKLLDRMQKEVDFLKAADADQPNFDTSKNKDVQKSREELEAAEKKRKEAQEAHDKAEQEARNVEDKKKKALDEADSEQKKALAIEEAEANRKALEEADQKVKDYEARDQAAQDAQKTKTEQTERLSSEQQKVQDTQKAIEGTETQLKEQGTKTQQLIQDFQQTAAGRNGGDGRIVFEGQDGSDTKRRFVGTNEQGVLVSNGSGTQLIPWDKVKKPAYLKEKARAVSQAQSDTQRLTTELDTQKAQLKQQQDTIRDTQDNISRADEALKKAPTAQEHQDYVANSNMVQDPYHGINAATAKVNALTQNGKLSPDDHRGNAKKLQDQAAQLDPEIKKLNDIAAEQRQKVTAAEEEHKTRKEALEQAEADAQKSAGRRQAAADFLTRETSGNATGGVGSSYKDFLSKLASGELEEMWNQVFNGASLGERLGDDNAKKLEAEENKKKEAQSQQDLQTLQGGDKKADPEAEKKKEEGILMAAVKAWDDLGKPAIERAQQTFGPGYGALLKEGPPDGKDPDSLHKTFEEANKAATEYAQHWAQAYLWSEAERQAQENVDHTEKMEKEEGDSTEKQTDEADTKGKELISKEEERKAKTEGKDIQTKKKDPQQGGLIAGVVSKLVDYAKYLKSKPSGGTVSNAGNSSGDAQDSADKESKEGKKTGVQGSNQQIKALHSMSDINQAMKKQVGTLRTELKAKVTKDKATIEEMRAAKAKELMAAEEKNNEATTKSNQFNSGAQELMSWAAKFKSSREAFAKGG